MSTLVDDDIYDRFCAFVWYVNDKGYATGRLSMGRGRKQPGKKGRSKIVLLHRLINETPPGKFTDHINRDKLDNRRCNLRSVTTSENMHNTDMRSTNTSGATGVLWSSYHKGWLARIVLRGKTVRLGCFHNFEEAREIVERAKREIFQDSSFDIETLKVTRRSPETRGTSWAKRAKLWFAYADAGGKRISLGYYKTREEAISARQRHNQGVSNHG